VAKYKSKKEHNVKGSCDCFCLCSVIGCTVDICMYSLCPKIL